MKSPKPNTQLSVTNANEHNLKNISVDIPRNQFVVMTGVSGSGKSSLAFDTIFKEGQRRYIASLSSYARQFIQNIDRPNVDSVDGLSPTICIDQKSAGRNPRSTVGTITEVYDFLRLLFSRLGTPHCPNGHGPITSQTIDTLIRKIFLQFQQKTLMVLAPIILDRKGEYRNEIIDLNEAGFVRVLVDGKLYRTEEEIPMERYEKHTIEVVIDRVEVLDENQIRINDAIQKAVALTKGKVAFLDYEKLDRSEQKKTSYASPDYEITNILNACSVCGESIKEMEPKLFSFNSPQDACKLCHGLGHIISFDPQKFIQDPDQAIFDGALSILNPEGNVLYTHRGRKQITELFQEANINLNIPWKNLPEGLKNLILIGNGEDEAKKSSKKTKKITKKSKKIKYSHFSCLEVVEKLHEKYNISNFKKYQIHTSCKTCQSSGLNPIALNVFLKDKNIFYFNQMQIKELAAFFNQVDLREFNENIWKPILKEIKERLFFLINVGLEYLTLSRKANTLSGGEAQRIRLASQVGSGLEGCLYILDEPSIGLHARDNEKLIQTLKLLKEKKNSLIVIEHDEETMLAADYLVELGPRAGIHGGEITYSDIPKNFKNFLLPKNKSKLAANATVAYLLGEKNILTPERRPVEDYITLKSVNEFNLKNLTIKFPLSRFTVLTGVSGSGKSTLFTILSSRINDILFRKKKVKNLEDKKVEGIENLEKIIEINQKPIGRTPRSNPATYTKMWEVVRDLFSQTKEAKVRGYKKGRFSFNVKGGRCEECGGAGIIKIETQIFSPIEVTCETCNGKRFNPATLDIDYKDKNIYEVLEMNFEEAEVFFEAIPKLKRIIQLINEIGLGYLKLGQPSTTLSGGEAQRIKIASELGRPSQGKTLYLLDEPTTGLHFDDIKKLLTSLQKLVDQKNTVVVIEHNLEVIKSSDHIIELGPEGGDKGGELVFTGTYEEILKSKTVTAKSIHCYHERQEKREKGLFLDPKNFSKLLNPSNLSKAETKQKSDNHSDQHFIEIVGLKTHNLKNVSLNIPKNQITVFTGVSGSGKTSIALDSIFIEGQRKYLESLSTYARRFLGRMQRPDADKIENLSPAIAIDQRRTSKNPRSIIATQTEIYDSLRVLFANVGHPHCTECDRRLEKYNETLATQKLLSDFKSDSNLLLLAPIHLSQFKHSYLLEKKSDFKEYLTTFKERGYQRFLIDQKIYKIDDSALITKSKTAKSIFIVIDRVSCDAENQDRLIEGIEKAYDISYGVVGISKIQNQEVEDFFLLTQFYSCPEYTHNVVVKDNLTPRHFSFNHHLGACEMCEGIGKITSLNFSKFISPTDSLLEGLPKDVLNMIPKDSLQGLNASMKYFNINFLEKTFFELSLREKKYFLYGVLDRQLLKPTNSLEQNSNLENKWTGIFSFIFDLPSSREPKDEATQIRTLIKALPKLRTFIEEEDCFKCYGGRLKPIYGRVKINGETIHDLISSRIPDFANFFTFITSKESPLSKNELAISHDTINEIVFRTTQLLKLGVDYLTLDRKVETLSGGEMQRIRLSTQIGNQLRDVIYVLDEPTIGLHERDNKRLIDVMQNLKSLGNTVLLVEHDASMIKSADFVVDVGPEAGERGGKIVYAGINQKNKLAKTSFYDYLYQRDNFRYPRQNYSAFNEDNDPHLEFKEIYRHNLINQNLKLPLQRLIAISGVSGSGKSTLLEWLHQELLNTIDNLFQQKHGFITGHQASASKSKLLTHYLPSKDLSINKVYLVEQTPVSLNKRSVILSYMEIFDDVRDVFAKTKGSKENGFTKSNFSFNSHAGGCRNCRGLGEEEIEMHFISDVTVICEECQGRRYQKEVLEIYYQGKNIFEVLEMTFVEGMEFFYSFKKIREKMQQIIDAGLGYLKLGFKTSLLSGGELQRLKIAHELAFADPSNSFYLLDEPTTGLHFKDIEKLVKLLERLVLEGGTVVVIEHNMEFLRSVDHLIELGLEGGDGGGKIINVGTPDQIQKDGIGHTATYL